MAYTTIDKPTDYFNTVTYTGNGGTQSITGVGFQPDWIWIKERNLTSSHALTDSVRGKTKKLKSDDTDAEETNTNLITSFDSDGFSLGDNGNSNQSSSQTYVAWNWLAGGTAPTITYTVKVVSDSGNKYRFDDFGTSAVTLDLQEGGTYTFDLSDSSNDGHPMKFSETSNGSHGGGSTYSTGVVYQLDGASVTESNYVSNFNSASSRKIIITVAASAPTLYYFCHYHSGMGGQANTNSTFGSSNFSGSIQSTVSANTTAGFSIVSYTGTGGVVTIGHGLGAEPKMIIIKSRSNPPADHWWVYHNSLGNGKSIYLNLSNASGSTNDWNSTTPTSSVFTTNGAQTGIGYNGANFIAYCFAEKKGYSKFGSYTANNNSDAPFVYTGFKPAWILLKASNNGSWEWRLSDSTRTAFNSSTYHNLFPSTYAAETNHEKDVDYVSNGFKVRSAGNGINNSGYEIIYMAFAESPFVNSNGVPINAR